MAGHTCNSIVINAPYEKIFDISNDITRWTELFGTEYKKAEVVKKEANKITFRLTDEDDKSWQSWRLLFKDKYFAYAEREEPKFPFKYMKIVWLYTPKPEGIEMTWIQHFEMEKDFKFNDQQIEGFINEGSKENLKIFKRIIEKEAAK
ncbi:MAG: SRPBCC family protein [Candidatus Omnitrophica bacterium]|nr:SRPBCC family protein [Candidatus Omnitrophota bacterium]